MAKLRGSIKIKLGSINEALMLAVTTSKDHADLIKMILAISESINKEIKS